MRPTIETVFPTPGYSFCFQAFEGRRLHFNWHKHPEAELVVFSSGAGQAHIGDAVADFGEPSAFLLDGGVAHAFAGDGPADGWIVQFPRSALGLGAGRPEFAPIDDMLEASGRGLRFSGPSVAEAARALGAAGGSTGLDRWIMLLRALEALASGGERESCSFAVARGGRDAFSDVVSSLFDEYAKPHSLSELSGRAGMSVSTFCRSFKRRVGLSFVDYLHSIRINVAKKLLIQTHLYVDDVCYECGFNNVSFFDRKFKAVTGMTPTAYRRKYSVDAK